MTIRYDQLFKRLATHTTEVVAEANELLISHSTDVQLMRILGHAQTRLKRYDDAEAMFKQASDLASPSVQLDCDLDLAMFYSRVDNHAQAARLLTEISRTIRDEPMLFAKLSRHQFLSDNDAAGRDALLAEVDLRYRDQRVVAAARAFEANNLQEAQRLATQILNDRPGDIDALSMFSQLALKAQHFEDAQRFIDQAIQIHPWYPASVKQAANLSARRAKLADRVSFNQQLCRVWPDDEANWLSLGLAQISAMQYTEASQTLQTAAVTFDSAIIKLQRAHVEKILGNTDTAIAIYKSLIDDAHYGGSAWWGLAAIKSYRFGDADISLMQAAATSLQDLEQRSQCLFALGKALEDTNRYNESFDAYLLANDTKPEVSFNAADFSDHCLNIIGGFNTDTIKTQASIRFDVTPIFILGMPRSGSTLVEQILASHDDVEATQELGHLPQIMLELNHFFKRKGIQEKDIPSKLTVSMLNELASRYIDDTKILRSDKPYFIDKLPTNFRLIGLIKMMFPDALIIDTERDFMACAFSNFRQHYGMGHDFSYSLSDTASYHSSYRLLMQHWHRLFSGAIYRQNYETFVASPTEGIDRLLAYIGLRHDEKCYRHHQQVSVVNTASSEQVKQPVHTKAVEHWRNFEPMMREQLEPTE